MNRFEATVSALCYSILRQRCPEAETGDDFAHNRIVRFVLDQHGRMPDYLRLPLVILTLGFSASSLLMHRKAFHRLPYEARLRQIEAWRSTPIGACRDLIRFYESFVIFAWYSFDLGGRRAPAAPGGSRETFHEAA